MIRVDALWLSVVPLDMRAGMDTLLAQVVRIFGEARPHHAYLFDFRNYPMLPTLNPQHSLAIHAVFPAHEET